jgi:hypothetical protein
MWTKLWTTHLENTVENNFQLTLMSGPMHETPGLLESVDVLNELRDRAQIDMDHVFLVTIRPDSISPPWISKMRTLNFRPGIDKTFDDTLPTRHSMLFVPISDTSKSTFRWIKSDITTDQMPDTIAFIKNEQGVYFDNRGNDKHLFFFLFGLGGNPEFNVLKEIF